jgi:basic membrane protein A
MEHLNAQLIKVCGSSRARRGAVTPAVAADKLKVGFIYVGPVGDFGWTYQHNQGRLAIEKAFPATRSRRPSRKRAGRPTSERSIEQLARTGHKLIFTTSFGYMEPTLKVAKKYPNVMFEHATGYKRDKNLATYSARFHEGRYMQGVIAGKMTKPTCSAMSPRSRSRKSSPASTPIMLGAQSVNPNIKVKIVWVNTWFDPGKEADAAKALLDQGADIITQHTDSPAPLQQAEARGKFAFGQDSDMIKFAPEGAPLTARSSTTGATYYIERVKLATRRQVEVGRHLGRL